LRNSSGKFVLAKITVQAKKNPKLYCVSNRKCLVKIQVSQVSQGL
jgi:hypothetical protein